MNSASSKELRSHYNFIGCGADSGGSVVAARLAENEGVQVLLLEAGGSDEVASVSAPAQWTLNLGSERDWNFMAEPNPHLNGRAIPMNMGEVLGSPVYVAPASIPSRPPLCYWKPHVRWASRPATRSRPASSSASARRT